MPLPLFLDEVLFQQVEQLNRLLTGFPVRPDVLLEQRLKNAKRHWSSGDLQADPLNCGFLVTDEELQLLDFLDFEPLLGVLGDLIGQEVHSILFGVLLANPS